jgi:hypothetical protein
MTITAGTASVISTVAGNLTLQAGSNTVTLGSSTALTATGALAITGGTTLSVESASGSAFTASAQGAGNTGLGAVGTGTTTLGATGLANVNILGPLSTTTTKGVQIGTADTSQTNLILDNANTFADAGTCSNSVNLGAMYYNDINPSAAAASSTGSIRVCEGIANSSTSATAAWTDLPSTADLGAILFGVVPDSGNTTNAQDLTSLITPGKSGPCKVSAVSASTVDIEPCVAYSGGRRVIVNNQTAFAITVTSGFTSICLSGTNNAPASTNGTTELNSLPSFSTTAPILCLASIAVNGTTITQVYDTRTFTTSTKEFVTTATRRGIGLHRGGQRRRDRAAGNRCVRRCNRQHPRSSRRHQRRYLCNDPERHHRDRRAGLRQGHKRRRDRRAVRRKLDRHGRIRHHQRHRINGALWQPRVRP